MLEEEDVITVWAILTLAVIFYGVYQFLPL
jgi:hypothetical protein